MPDNRAHGSVDLSSPPSCFRIRASCSVSSFKLVYFKVKAFNGFFHFFHVFLHDARNGMRLSKQPASRV